MLLALCAGNSPVTGEFPLQRPVTRCFAVFFELRMNKRLSKQSWGWWFETPSWSLWRHCNAEIRVTGAKPPHHLKLQHVTHFLCIVWKNYPSNLWTNINPGATYNSITYSCAYVLVFRIDVVLALPKAKSLYSIHWLNHMTPGVIISIPHFADITIWLRNYVIVIW